MCAPSCERDCFCSPAFRSNRQNGPLTASRRRLRVETPSRPALFGWGRELGVGTKIRYGRWRLSAPEDDGPATTWNEPTHERCPFSCKLYKPGLDLTVSAWV